MSSELKLKLQLLPSTFSESGGASRRQHLSCLIVDEQVAIDAGSLAMATTDRQKRAIRDVILTHAHLDHIAGLPLYIDDLFAVLTEPVRIFATGEVIEVLETHIFNWQVYPRFSELKNQNGAIMEYHPFEIGKEFGVKHLSVRAINVNHKVPAVGFIVSDGEKTFAVSGDTAEPGEFWDILNRESSLDALLIECAFPDELSELAQASHHLTPKILKSEIANFKRQNCPIYVINLKPMYRNDIVRQIEDLQIENLQILEVGKIYDL